MTEIARVYAPGTTAALTAVADDGIGGRGRRCGWSTRRRELLRVLGPDYLERFTYRNDEVLPMARELNAILTARLPEAGLSVRGVTVAAVGGSGDLPDRR